MNRMRLFKRIGFGAMVLASAYALTMACNSARAQSDAPSPAPPPGRDVFYMRMGGGPMGPDAMGFVGFEGDLGGKTVTGSPFSATISTQTTQVLADGNHIDRMTSGTIARDSQGRTRRDMTLPAIGPWSTSGQAAPHVVFINDSVTGTQYILQPDKKVARKLQMQWMHHGKRGAATAPGAQGDVHYEAAGQVAPNSVSTTSIGTQTINGVQAEGTRTTRTIPAGAIGNANAIVITSERWYSADLQTVVLSKRSDPFTGETTFQLTNIQKQEPDASLFQVPSDYAVKQGGPGGGKRFKGTRVPPPSPAPDAQQSPTSQD
jgi:hypothetical protein